MTQSSPWAEPGFAATPRMHSLRFSITWADPRHRAKPVRYEEQYKFKFFGCLPLAKGKKRQLLIDI
jgi:hypothetical protein